MTNLQRPLDSEVLDRLFRTARSRNAWEPAELPEAVWKDLYDLLKLGPTSANCSPGRFLFCVTPAAKARAARHMSATNAQKSVDASAIVIIGEDLDFAEKLPVLFPHAPSAKYWFGDETVRKETAFRNSSLQGAYLMVAARALGLDIGPISGFDNAAIDAEFFLGTSVKSNFICMLGYGADTSFERLPRLSFEDACQLL